MKDSENTWNAFSHQCTYAVVIFDIQFTTPDYPLLARFEHKRHLQPNVKRGYHHHIIAQMYWSSF